MEILVYRNGIPKVQENFTAADLPELLKDEFCCDLGRHGAADGSG